MDMLLTQVHDINEDAYEEWREYRQKELRKRIGAMAEKKQRQMLSKYSPPVQQQIIDASIMNSWTGLFEPKNQAPRAIQAGSTRATSIIHDLTDRGWAD